MVSGRRLLVEGGGDRHDLKSECRRGFRRLLERAGLGGAMPRIVACGGRRAAYDHYAHALETKSAHEVVFLLVDSEGPVSTPGPWEHVEARPGDQWPKPEGARDRDLHLMVQVMEAWFLADPEALQRFSGQGFRPGALPRREDVEAIPKQEVFAALRQATKHTWAGPYGKGKHSFKLLAQLDPRKIELASAWARRLLETLSN